MSLPMAEPYSIDELIGEHQQALNFSWLTATRPGPLSFTATMTYWIGDYAPEHHHAIEILQRQNLPLFEQALQQDRFYFASGMASARPSLFIFADDVVVTNDTQASLQAHGVAAVQTPLPSKLILRELAYSLAQTATQQTRHGVMLSIYDQGILLTGDSGIGKSALALELIARGHSLVADDAPLFHRFAESGPVFALCPPQLADLLEVRALGILNVCKLFGPQASSALMPVDLIVELVESFTPNADQRLQPYAARTNILGMDIPSLPIPINHTANLALIVETLTKNHVLYKEGYDASAILIQRQQQILTKQTV